MAMAMAMATMTVERRAVERPVSVATRGRAVVRAPVADAATPPRILEI